MDLFTSLLDQLAKQNAIEKPVPQNPERKKRHEAELFPKPLCLRCPSSLKRQQRSSVTKLCRDCSAYYCRIKKETENADLSVAEFIERYPSRYSLSQRLCQRCRPALKRRAGKLGLCKSCCSQFYNWRTAYRAQHPEKFWPAVDLFITCCPARKEKVCCRRCPPHLAREAIQLGLCASCTAGFYQWRRTYHARSVEEADPAVETFLEQCPRRYRTTNVAPLCIRCSRHGQRSSITSLCGGCGTYYHKIKKDKSLPDLSVEEFMKMHPARKRV